MMIDGLPQIRQKLFMNLMSEYKGNTRYVGNKNTYVFENVLV